MNDGDGGWGGGEKSWHTSALCRCLAGVFVVLHHSSSHTTSLSEREGIVVMG